MPSITIGFTPRESFALAATALQRLYEKTALPFHLIVVDANTPEVYRQPMLRVLADKPDVEVLRSDEYLLPGESKNRVIRRARGDLLCLIEFDVLVHDGWLEKLVAAIEEHPADVAVPLLLEGQVGSRHVHFDTLMGRVVEHRGPDGVQLEILPDKRDKQADRGAGRRTVEFFEQHCVLYRRSVFDRIAGYEAEMNTRSEIDLALQVRAAGLRAVFEPACEVNFVPPYPPERAELDYFRMRWDVDRARRSRELLQRKWNLESVPGSIYFVEDRMRWAQLHEVGARLRELVSADETIVLIDDGQWQGLGIVDGLRTLPFLERNGVSWGMPADDAQAIAELHRMRREGAALAVIAWPSFWWLEHFAGLRDHLQAHCKRVIDDEVMVAFDLRAMAG